MRWQGAILALLAALSASAGEGLLATFRSGDSQEITVLPNFAFFAASNQPPAAFVSNGPFEATIEGHISAELRMAAVFVAESAGDFVLHLNGRPILTNNGQSASILLKKGTNLISATYKSRLGENQLRVQWIPKRIFLQPIPSKLLSHDSSNLTRDQELRLGRALFLEKRCANCHKAEGNSPELQMGAPAFDEIGTRLTKKWMRDWITNPAAHRTNASMPNLFHGDAKKAEAAAAYLATLGGRHFPKLVADASRGEKIYQTQNCAACHAVDVSLEAVNAKFKEGALEDYLRDPGHYFPWTEMPAYKFTPQERADLAAYLRKGGKPEADASSNLVSAGKDLVEKSGCIACHSLGGKKIVSEAPTLASLNPSKGCLADAPPGNVPLYTFSSEQRTALRAFVQVKKPINHAPMEFAARKLEQLKCLSCHGVLSGIPPINILGGKLKRAALSKMVAGTETNKPRYWMEAQMPGFHKAASYLPEGMAALHGVGSDKKAESPVNQNFADTGRKLVSAPPHGFSCIACHAVDDFGSKEPFEAPGINLARTYERLRPDYFTRWLRNPTLIDPLTKMPVYFDDEGRSPLIEILDGNAAMQIEAMWEYLKQPNIPPPFKE